MKKITLPITGMHCRSCEIMIGSKLLKVPGVKQVQVSQKNSLADVYYETEEPNKQEMHQAVADAGYIVGVPGKLPWISKDTATYRDFTKAILLFIILYFVIQKLGLTELSVDSTNKSFFMVLVIGLVAGVSTCMALIGGLVLSFTARHAEVHPEATKMQRFRPHLFFNGGRILGYTFFGGIIGLLGTAFKLSTPLLGFLTLLVGLVMIFVGLKLIEIFPKLREKSLTLPPSVSKFFGLQKDTQEYSHKGAMIAGALTFFLPCGFTQAMQIYAVSTGSFTKGAIIMGLFALGTAPGLLGIGGLSSFFQGKRARVFFMLAGIAVILFGFYSIQSSLLLLTPQEKTSTENVAPQNQNGETQEIRMTQDGRGYNPKNLTVTLGKKVRWIITSTNPYSCASSLRVPSYGIEKDLDAGENIIEFTPTKLGRIPFSCSMGMYRGVINVVE
jgi:sulfite exporter TauE/SafE/copper chaperone CopZ